MFFFSILTSASKCNVLFSAILFLLLTLTATLDAFAQSVPAPETTRSQVLRPSTPARPAASQPLHRLEQRPSSTCLEGIARSASCDISSPLSVRFARGVRTPATTNPHTERYRLNDSAKEDGGSGLGWIVLGVAATGGATAAVLLLTGGSEDGDSLPLPPERP